MKNFMNFKILKTKIEPKLYFNDEKNILTYKKNSLHLYKNFIEFLFASLSLSLGFFFFFFFFSLFVCSIHNCSREALMACLDGGGKEGKWRGVE